MNSSSTTTISLIPPIATLETGRLSFHTTRPEFSSFKFKNIGQPPTLLSRFSDARAASDYRSSSPARSDMDITFSEDHTMMDIDDHRTPYPTPRRTLLDMLGGSADQGHNPKITITQMQDPRPTVASPTSAPLSSLAPTRPESPLSSGAEVPYTDPSSPRASVAPEVHKHEPPDSDMSDLHADPVSPPRSPLSLFADLSEAVRETAELNRITSLHNLLTSEREELLTRHDETARALSRTKTQLDRVLSLTDEAIQMTTGFVDKEKDRLETKKAKAEAKLEHRKNLEAEQRRKTRELERIRYQEEERKAQAEIEQQAERQRFEDQRRRDENLAAERRRQGEIQARERAQAEERRRLELDRSRIEEEERRRLAEEERRKRHEEERTRQAEEQRREEEERVRGRLAEEREAAARKQQEERRIQLFERRRLVEEERRQKEAEAAAKAEAEKQAAEEEQQRIFQERRASFWKDKFKGYDRPESGVPPTGLTSTLEGTSSSSLPSIIVNDVPTNSQVIQHPATVKIHRARDTPTFVPATTEAGRLPPDLSQQVKLSNNPAIHAVKHETTSPVITPIDDAQPVEGTPPSQLPSLPISSISASVPTPLPMPSHLPARPAPIRSQPPVSTSSQQREQSPPRHYPHRRSRSRSRSPQRSPRRRSPTSRSPDPARGRYQPPPAQRRMGMDHYSPPRDGGPRYDRDSRSNSPPPPHPNPRKRGHWARADTPSKLDYSHSHPTKRRAASPHRSRSPPAVPTRRQPLPSRRGRGGGQGGGQSSHVPLEQRLSDAPPPLALRERLGPQGWDGRS